MHDREDALEYELGRRERSRWREAKTRGRGERNDLEGKEKMGDMGSGIR